MTRVERRRFIEAVSVGFLITSLIILADITQHLQAMESWLYDRRVEYFQFFSAPPTDRIVHLGIDDSAINSIGSWPWSRQTMADLLEEITEADPKVIFFDIVFAEAKEGDAEFAAAVSRAKRVLLPYQFRFVPGNYSPEFLEIKRTLIQNLELTPDELRSQLAASIVGTDKQRFEELFIEARREAMFERIRSELRMGELKLTELATRLIPNDTRRATSTALQRLLIEQHERYLKLKELDRFTRPMVPGLPRTLPAADSASPVPVLAQAATFSGFVDYVPDEGGVVRTVPLWIEHGGRLVPQVSLALACAALGVNPDQIQLRSDSITIAPPGRSPIVIPTRTETSDRYGSYGTVMDLPWIGRPNDWQTVYSASGGNPHPAFVSASAVWNVVQPKKAMQRNLRPMDAALLTLLLTLDPDKAQALAAGPITNAQRAELIQQVEKTAPEVIAGLKEAGVNDQAKALEEKLAVLLAGRNSNIVNQQRYEQERAKLKNLLADRAVLVGWVASLGTPDFITTPLHDRCPGVVAHGIIYNAILSGELWRTAPRWWSVAISAAFGLIISVVVGWRSPVFALLLALMLGLGYFLVNGLLVFDYGNTIVGMAGPLTVVAICWSGLTLLRFVTESTERQRITRRFRSYVDPSLVDYVIQNPELARLEGQVRELTVVFTDLAGFTALSERLREKAVIILNRYMDRMVPLIRRHKGYVNKFLGDGIMFFYGAPLEDPDHAAAAVTTVLDMLTEMKGLNDELMSENLPTISMRAGVSTGEMVVGDAGSADAADYTVLGDTVNLGSRLEGANKPFGTQVLISARTAELVRDRFLLRPVGAVQVLGRGEAERVYEPLGPLQSATEAQKQLVDLTAAVVAAFQEGRFADCLTAIDELESAGHRGKLTALYRLRSEEYLRDGSPQSFRGEMALQEK